MHGESSSNESTPSSTWKTLLVVTFGMGIAMMLSLIVAIFMLMFLSFGNEMWPILLKLKIGPGP